MPKTTATQQDNFETVTQPSQEELMAILGKFGGGEFSNQEAVISYPKAKLLNLHKNYGLFISETDIEKSEWIGALPNLQTVRYQNKETEKGLLFNADCEPPRVQILYQSPLYVQLIPKLEKFQDLWNQKVDEMVRQKLFNSPTEIALAKSYSLLGIYRNTDGRFNDRMSAIHKLLTTGKPKLSQIATYWYIRLLDQNNNPLHGVPIELYTKGTGSVHWSNQFNSFVKEVENIRCQLTNQTYDASKQKSSVFKGLCVFQPLISSEEQGSEETSVVATVVGFINPEPNPQSFMNAFLYKDEDRLYVEEQQKALKANSLKSICSDGFTSTIEEVPATPPSPVDPVTGEDIDFSAEPNLEEIPF